MKCESRSRNMWKVCLFSSEKSWQTHFWETHKVCKGLWAFYLDCFSGAAWLSRQTLITWIIILTYCTEVTVNLHVHVLQCTSTNYLSNILIFVPKLRGGAFPFLTHDCKGMVFFAHSDMYLLFSSVKWSHFSSYLQSLILYKLQVVKKWQTLHIHLPLTVKWISL